MPALRVATAPAPYNLLSGSTFYTSLISQFFLPPPLPLFWLSFHLVFLLAAFTTGCSAVILPQGGRSHSGHLAPSGFSLPGWAPTTCVLCSAVGFSWGWEEGTGAAGLSGASGLQAPPRRPCGLCSNCACPRMALRAVSPGRDGGVRQFPPGPAAVRCACWPAPSSASSKPRWPHLLLPPPPRPNPGGKTPPQEEATWRGCA